jgi:ribose transport system substrate-binding protein
MRISKMLFVLVIIGALALGVAACGGSDDSTAASDAGGTSTNAGESTDVQAAIDAAFEGTFREPPSESPPVQPGKKVWFIPISAATSDYSAIHDAADAMGWDLTDCDGKFSPDAIVSCIRQAIAADADGIVLYVVDCSAVTAGLKDAHDAGIPVVSGEGSDCDEEDPAQPALFDATTRWQGESEAPIGYIDFLKNVWAKTVALGLINGTDGEGKILDIYESDLFVTRQQDEAVKKHLRELCPDCEIVDTVEFTGAEIGAPLQQKIEQALTQHPDINAVFNPHDGVTPITAAAIRSSGRQDDIYNVGAEGQPSVLSTIGSGDGTIDAAAALSINWDLYATLDALNHLFNGETEPTEGWPTGNGTQLVDKDHNLPPKDSPFDPPIDYRSAYLKAWGVN